MVESTLPLPEPIENEEDKEVNFLSVIFHKKQRADCLQMSKDAMTPLWMGKRDYTKLKIECEFKAEKPDLQKLQKMYDDFCHH